MVTMTVIRSVLRIVIITLLELHFNIRVLFTTGMVVVAVAPYFSNTMTFTETRTLRNSSSYQINRFFLLSTVRILFYTKQGLNSTATVSIKLASDFNGISTSTKSLIVWNTVLYHIFKLTVSLRTPAWMFLYRKVYHSVDSDQINFSYCH